MSSRGFTFIQYVIMSWVRDGIAVNPKDICLTVPPRQRCADPRHRPAGGTRPRGARAPRPRPAQGGTAAHRAGRKTVESLIPLVVDKLNLALADFSSEEVKELKRLLIKLNTRLESTLDPKASPRRRRPSSPRTASQPPARRREADMRLKAWLLLGAAVLAGCVTAAPRKTRTRARSSTMRSDSRAPRSSRRPTAGGIPFRIRSSIG